MHSQGYHEKKAFIIAQSPMENTVRDFWKMIVDYKVSAIVMLCRLGEVGQYSYVHVTLSHVLGFVLPILASKLYS